MNWNNGFSARYYYTLIDPVSWRETERRELTGGSVTRSEGGLMHAASINMTEALDGVDAWIRIWLDARQSGDGERQALFTGLMSIPSMEWEGTRKSVTADCYSVLKAADDVILPRGWFAPAGRSGAEIAAELLGVGPAPVEYEEDAPMLTAPIIAENNESNLSMAQKVVNAIGWRIRISGEGVISIEPTATEESAMFDTTENDCVEISVTDKRDYFSCPNVFQASSGDLTATARDDELESELSTIGRGREIWMIESNVALNDGESIEEYVVRRLKEEQSPARTIGYTRRFRPDLYPGDIVRLNFPAQGVSGAFRITSQTINLGFNAGTEEEVVDT